MSTPPEPRNPYNTPVPGNPPTPQAPPIGPGGTSRPPGMPPGPGAIPGGRNREGSNKTFNPVGTEPSGSAGQSRTFPVTALVISATALLLGGLGVGVGVLAYTTNSSLQQEVDALRAQQAEVDTALASLNERTGEGLADYLQDLDWRVSAAENAASGAATDAQRAAGMAQYAEDYAFSVDSRLGGVVECINTYMKTVGDSGGGYYRYYFC